MKRVLSFVALSLVLCSLVAARPNVATSTEDQIVQLERNWLAAEATGDLTTLRSLIADDFIGASVGPGVLTKDDIVPVAPTDNAGRLPKSTLADSTVRVFGDCAVLVGHVTFDDAKQPGGLRVTSIYQKRGDRWQMIAADLSPTPVGH
ncbi:MAG: nuclear transport factor 2 family protein [Candidatus Acidiferrales bacterium]